MKRTFLKRQIKKILAGFPDTKNSQDYIYVKKLLHKNIFY